ncbi:unnamed protein product, partial [Timema podura]|nr:unnamed protein product [Timema podura]
TMREYYCPRLCSKDRWRAPRVPGSPLRQVMGTERCRSGELRSSYSSHCDVLSVVGEDSRTMEHRVKHLLVVTGLLVANLDSADVNNMGGNGNELSQDEQWYNQTDLLRWPHGRCVTCWMCSSIIAGQDDCKDPFNVSRSFGYKVNCDLEISSPPPGHKQYCKKIVLQHCIVVVVPLGWFQYNVGVENQLVHHINQFIISSISSQFIISSTISSQFINSSTISSQLIISFTISSQLIISSTISSQLII